LLHGANFSVRDILDAGKSITKPPCRADSFTVLVLLAWLYSLQFSIYLPRLVQAEMLN
jgi:hypothetical protein